MLGVVVIGGGPAGAAAAIAARREGSQVRLVERTRAERHKLCGEFITPENLVVLDGLELADEFLGLAPARIRRCLLHVGERTLRWTLEEPAWGLSRFTLDAWLLASAARSGVEVQRGEAGRPQAGSGLVLATGRRGMAGRGEGGRLFGFKAHFEGPVDDAVELFFSRGWYAGISGVENGRTNVCGLAPETLLRQYDFDVDAMLHGSARLRERLAPLRRCWEWVRAGPLVFSAPGAAAGGVYPAGDALGFVDPFTGSGILNALLTGSMAGRAAARGRDPGVHVRECAALLERPFRTAAMLRAALDYPALHCLAPLLPGRWLFRWTRAKVAPAHR